MLWAYKTTRKSTTQETPFALAFGTEAVALVEIELKSPMIELASVEHNKEALRLNLDLLDEKRDQVQKRKEDYQRKTTRYYDQKVKPRSYKPSDLVLKKLLLARKNPTHGKLGPTGKAPISCLTSSDLVTTNSKRKKEKFYLILGMLSSSSVFINRPLIVIFNKVSPALRYQSVCSLIVLFNILMDRKKKKEADSLARSYPRKLHISKYTDSSFKNKKEYCSLFQ